MSNTDTITIRADTSLKEAARIIDAGSIGIALVVDASGALLSIITDDDIRMAILKGTSVSEPVSAITNKGPFYLNKDEYKKKIQDATHDSLKQGQPIPIVGDDNAVVDVVSVEDGAVKHFSKDEIKNTAVKKVLVIGGAGYIGSVLVRLLLNEGYSVRVLDKCLYGKESLADIDSDQFELVEGDTRHIETLTDSLIGVDAIVHLAELVGDPMCAVDPKKTIDINYLATHLIGLTAKLYQINRLVYISSCSVYGSSAGDSLLNEESALNPVSLYAKQKLESEQALLGLADENFSPTILRLGTVFGMSHRPRFDLVVNLLTAKAILEKNITIFGGNQWRPNVHVKDVSRAILAVLRSDLPTVARQTFNVGQEHLNFTITDLGKQIHSIIPDAKLSIDDSIEDKRNYRIDFSKIRNALGFESKYDIVYGIKEIQDAFVKGSVSNYTDVKFSNFLHMKEHKDSL